jgi:hypothetical protein
MLEYIWERGKKKNERRSEREKKREMKEDMIMKKETSKKR